MKIVLDPIVQNDQHKVLRGGCWSSKGTPVLSSYTIYPGDPGQDSIGFRASLRKDVS